MLPPFLSSLLSLPFLFLLFQPSGLSCFCFLHFAFSLFLSVLFSVLWFFFSVLVGFPPSPIPVLPNFVLFVGPFHPISSPSTLFISLGVLPSAFFPFSSSSGYSKLLFHPQPYLISFFFLSSCLLFHPSFSVTCSSCVCFSSVHYFILHFLPFMPLCLCSSFLFMLHFLFLSCPLPALSLFLTVSNLPLLSLCFSLFHFLFAPHFLIFSPPFCVSLPTSITGAPADGS